MWGLRTERLHQRGASVHLLVPFTAGLSGFSAPRLLTSVRSTQYKPGLPAWAGLNKRGPMRFFS